MPITRRDFVKISGVTLAGFMVGLDSCNSNELRVSGHVYDLYGFPVKGASVSMVTGYSLKNQDVVNGATSLLSGPVHTDESGAFKIALGNPNQDVGLLVRLQDGVPQHTVVRQVTGTNIPFYETEIWSTDTTKWVNDIAEDGTLNNVSIYIDPSRVNMWVYFVNYHSELVYDLQNNKSQDGESAWEGDHMDPVHSSNCVGGDDGDESPCDNHYGNPEMVVRSRKINPPWGSERGVIPFVCGEGTVLSGRNFVLASEGTLDEILGAPDIVYVPTPSINGEDGDDDWEVILEPQYEYLRNIANTQMYASYLVGRDLGIHCEMCRMFRNQTRLSTADDLNRLSNISVDEDFSKFINKRIWMVGTWTKDTGHSQDIQSYENVSWNEMHPVYWMVPFIGGCLRFYASELIRVTFHSAGAKLLIEAQKGASSNDLLLILNENISNALTLSPDNAATLYQQSITHLDKFGLNFSLPNAPTGSGHGEVANASSDAAAIAAMVVEIQRRYAVIYNHLTTLGSGYLVFSSMLFIYEGTDIFANADGFQLSYPATLVLLPGQSVEGSLGMQALGYHDNFFHQGLIDLQAAYKDIIYQLASSTTITMADKAWYYAKASVRLISYGMYDDDADNVHHNSSDVNLQYQWAFDNLETQFDLAVNLINDRLTKLWNDAFPFTRTI